ncbi:MAG: NAD-dependent epimerase/dehydratase family protein [Proteobacteria bacterium]|nr:NAD-dependent epimerase/dehydratase family protein [Pseudomonadota bacterium]HQR04687.1 NAD-dependent epimerase/dehydratase family protein [Rhodocyclaceae bacterium]
MIDCKRTDIVTGPPKPCALVTGASGFIGGHLAEALVYRGWRVKVLVRDAGRLLPTLRDRCAVVVGNLIASDTLAGAVRDVDIIFHCAANVNTWDVWDAYHSVNVTGVQNLLEAVGRYNPGLSRFMHLSTVDVYGFPKEPCDESCETPRSGFGYGDSKLLGEAVVRKFAQSYGIPYTIVRPTNVIGSGSQFIVRIGAAYESGMMLTIDGGRINAGMLYVGNLVDHLVWAAQADMARDRCYNVRDPYEVTWADFLAVFRNGAGCGGRTVDLPFGIAETVATGLETFHRLFLPRREPRLHRLIVRTFGRTCGHSAARIHADRGAAPVVGFDEAMKQSLQWYREVRACK